MTAELWIRIEAIFAEALALPEAERPSFVDASCGNDETLGAEVRRLLAAHETGSSVLDTPPDFVSALAPPDEVELEDLSGTRAGPWRLLQVVGSGGMGQVYLAERADGVYEGQVAVKVLRRGLDTDDLLRRFRAERQILANLQHPNISRLIDGGALPDGRPFLVLEYVDGVPITTYADSHDLSVDARIELFVTVCMAVQSAHQALVVHRDLKPANILVSDANVKLLDFGIAKLLDAESLESPQTVARNVRMMTPAYASPEQIRGDAITTGSDVYALGVVLYELLTGHRPYDFVGVSRVDAERMVCEVEPPRPSSVAPDRWRRLLRGDLDTILSKAMAKEPSRRYGSAMALADDLRRHRDGQPVVARPSTLAYRAATFVRRHQFAVSASAIIALLLVGFSVVTAVQSNRIRTQAVVVERERDRAEQVLGFMTGLFSAADPTGRLGTDVTASELLEAGRLQVERDLDGQPAVQATMMDAMGRVYLTLGTYDEAERLASAAMQLRGDLFGPEHPEVAESLHLLGEVAAGRSRLAEADSLLSLSLAIRQASLPPDDPALSKNLVDLAWIRMLRGDYGSSDALNQAALARRRRTDDTLGVAEVLNNLGILRRRQSELEDGARLHVEALAMRRALYGGSHYFIGQSLNNLAIVRSDQGDHVAAESLLTAAIPQYERALGPDHPDVLNSISNRAKELQHLGDLETADSLFRHVLTSYETIFGADHFLIALILQDLGEIQHEWGRLDEAESLLRESLAMRRRVFGNEHREVAWALNALARVRRDQGAHAESDALLSEAAAMQQ